MSRRRSTVALGIAAIALVCGVSAIAANFGILSRTHHEPVGRFVQPANDHPVPTTGARSPRVATVVAVNRSRAAHDS